MLFMITIMLVCSQPHFSCCQHNSTVRWLRGHGLALPCALGHSFCQTGHPDSSFLTCMYICLYMCANTCGT
jgi:hypothetical protein